jgi:hypothetical protein
VSYCISMETSLPDKLSPFLELVGDDDSQGPMVVEFPEIGGEWAGGVLDPRSLLVYIEGLELGEGERWPLPYLNFLVRWVQVIPGVLFWIIVAHNLDFENVDKVLAQYFSNFFHVESDYIPGKDEAIFFSKTSLIETNGVKVYVLEAASLVGRLRVLKSEDKRFQSVSTYGEALLHSLDAELKMEVYLWYMR